VTAGAFTIAYLPRKGNVLAAVAYMLSQPDTIMHNTKTGWEHGRVAGRSSESLRKMLLAKFFAFSTYEL